MSADSETPEQEVQVEQDTKARAEAKAIVKKLRERFGDAVMDCDDFRGDLSVSISHEKILDACMFLRDEPEFHFEVLMDLCGVDYHRERPRFAVVYHLYSVKHGRRLRLKVPLERKDPKVDSVIPVWKAANWFEREAWDMYGIRFRNHPNLRRILTHEEFEGHPLRKDYDSDRRHLATRVVEDVTTRMPSE